MNIRVLGTAALFLLASAVAHSGDTFASDPKPVAELNLMTDQEIRLDAYSACSEASIAFTVYEHSSKVLHDLVEAEAYLKLLGRVARQRNNGVEPLWVQQAHQAYQQRDSGKACAKVFAADLQKPAQHLNPTP